MNNLIYYYGDWDSFIEPTNHSTWFIQWDKGQPVDMSKVSAISYWNEDIPKLHEIMAFIVNREGKSPIHISRDYKDFE